MHPNLELDCAREAARIQHFIQQTLAVARRSRLVLGLSGGVDSALVAVLAARAIGPENVYGLLMPYRTSNPASMEHGLLVARNLGINHRIFEITPMVEPLLQACPQMSAVRAGNIMARSRMVVWYDWSEEVQGLVAGTSNRTETLLGYFTMHGDSAASLKPISHLYKCQVRQLAYYLQVPQVIIEKAPSADLWEGQTDEGDLGFTYDQADEALYLLTECQWRLEDLPERGISIQTAQAIQRRMENTAFKRAAIPALVPANRIATKPVVA